MISRIGLINNINTLAFKGRNKDYSFGDTPFSEDHYSFDEFIRRSSSSHVEVSPRRANPPKTTVQTIKDAAVGVAHNHSARVFADKFDFVTPSCNVIKDYNRNIRYFDAITREGTNDYFQIRDSFDSVNKLSLGLSGSNLLKKGKSFYEYNGKTDEDKRCIIFYDEVKTKSSVSSAYGNTTSPVFYFEGHQYDYKGDIKYSNKAYDFIDKIVYDKCENLGKNAGYAKNAYVLDPRTVSSKSPFGFVKHIGKPVMFKEVEFADGFVKASAMIVFDVDRDFVVKGATTYINPVISISEDNKEFQINAKYSTQKAVPPFRANGIHYFNQDVEVNYEPVFGETFNSSNCLQVNDLKEQAVHYIGYQKDEIARRPSYVQKRVVNFADIRKR